MTPSKQMDIRKTIDLILQGNSSAWVDLYSRYYHMSFKILGKYSSSMQHADKEDVVQNAFTKLHRSGLKNFTGDTEGEWRCYLRRILINEAHTFHNAQKGPQIDDPNTIPETEDKSPGPARIAEAKERLEKVMRFLITQPLKKQMIFLLNVWGNPESEISRMMGIPVGTVASSISRVREKIRQLLNEEGNPGMKSPDHTARKAGGFTGYLKQGEDHANPG